MKAALNRLTGKAPRAESTSLDSDGPDLRGKTAVITGGTGGAGFEVARTLAHARARVLLISRSAERATEAIRAIRQSQRHAAGPLPDVTFVECDLRDLAHVRRVADRIREQEPRLDLLICNADVGVNENQCALTAGAGAGLEPHFAVAHLGHFVFANRLLPLLRASAAPTARIVVMSSALYAAAPPEVAFASRAEITGSAAAGATALFARSELARVLFVKYGLAPRTGGRVLALATHPGAAQAGSGARTGVGAALRRVGVPFARAPAQGAAGAVWAATSAEVECDSERWHGRYIAGPGDEGRESALACDEELGGRLWALSEEIVREELGEDALLPWDVGENEGDLARLRE